MRLKCVSCMHEFEGERNPEGLDLCRNCGGKPVMFTDGRPAPGAAA